MWHTGLSSRVVNETKKKTRHEHIGTQKRAAQFNRQRRGQRQRWVCQGQKTATIQEKKGMREGMDPIPVNQKSVRDKLVNSVVQLRLNRVLRQILFNGRCQSAFHRSKRTTRGTVVKTSFSNVCTMVAEQLGWAVRNE